MAELWELPSAVTMITQALEKYAELLTPWAEATAGRMLADVSRRDEAAWAALAKTMQRALRAEVRNAPTGELFRGLMNEQVTLIKSLPLDSAKRVHELVLRNQEGAIRAKTLAAELMRTGEVTIARANTIARTETARAASTLLQARAEHIGSVGYVWRSSEDSDVRPSHRKLNGQFFRWDDPPISEADGVTRSHPGQVYNCRCYPEPIIPEENL